MTNKRLTVWSGYDAAGNTSWRLLDAEELLRLIEGVWEGHLDDSAGAWDAGQESAPRAGDEVTGALEVVGMVRLGSEADQQVGTRPEYRCDAQGKELKGRCHPEAAVESYVGPAHVTGIPLPDSAADGIYPAPATAAAAGNFVPGDVVGRSVGHVNRLGAKSELAAGVGDPPHLGDDHRAAGLIRNGRLRNKGVVPRATVIGYTGWVERPIGFAEGHILVCAIRRHSACGVHKDLKGRVEGSSATINRRAAHHARPGRKGVP